MRPLRLELEGFTSFRERTEVSFEETDLFVFTGATGSGKSSLIDAMIFALYGSVPRYDDRRLVAPVISQGKVRARVRLDFEARGRVYTAVRVIQRTKTGASTREARLEEWENGEPSRTIAATEAELSTSIQNHVIGLGLDHFTKCVVLPQGEFAAFLRAKPGERKQLLERLLGLGLYDKLRKAANLRWKLEENREGQLQSQLESALAHATPEAVREAEARVATLNELTEHIDEVSADLSHLATAVQTASEGWTKAARHLELVAEVRVPEGTAVLATRHQEADEKLREAARARDATAGRLRAAQTARNDLPERAAVEQLVKKREDLARLKAKIVAARSEVDEAAEAFAAATRDEKSTRQDHSSAKASLEDLPARQELENVRKTRRQLAELESGIGTRREALTRAEEEFQAAHDREASIGAALSVAQGDLAALPTREKLEAVQEKWEQLALLEGDADRTRSNLTRVEEAFAAAVHREESISAALAVAQGDLAALPTKEKLEAVREKWARLALVEGEADRTGDELVQANEELAAAGVNMATMKQQLEAATQELEGLKVAHSAADLARHLEKGRPCPVCLQSVLHLHHLEVPADLETARRIKDGMTAEVAKAQEELQRCEVWRASLNAKLGARKESLASLRGDLAEEPTGDEIVLVLTQMSGMEARARKLEGDYESADQHLQQCRRERDTKAEAHRQVEMFARSLREDLAGKPTGDEIVVLLTRISETRERIGKCESDLVRAKQHRKHWELLRGRAVEKLQQGEEFARRLQEDLAGMPTDDAINILMANINDAEEQVRVRKARWEIAVAKLRKSEGRMTAANAKLDEQKAFVVDLRTDVAEAEARVPEARTPEETSMLLEEIDATDKEVVQAQREEASAQRAVEMANAELRNFEKHVRAAWSVFHDSRDRVAEMKPPGAVERNLSQSWTVLSRWAEMAYAETEEQLARLDAEVARASRDRRRLDAELRERCRTGGLSLEGDEDPATKCAAALGAARQRLDGLRAAAAQRERVENEKKDARERARIARDLGRHLNAINFGAWLQNQILAWLVQGATVRLRELSSGQYSLDLSDKNEFLVIDHRNADEPRLAKTLSGGETFLASLALALSLAEQVANLAAQGSAKLEALFLDEGFGTLDSEMLDVVAATIEQLGTERMVGIVTHVSELADRIPVQYRVKKVGNSSSVKRVEA